MDWNVVFGQLGWSGILAAALVFVFKLYVQAQDRQIVLLQDAIKALEKRADSCERDRNALHERLEELLMKWISD